MELVGVGEGILDRDRLEERELVAVCIDRVERDCRHLAPTRAKQVSRCVRRDREQPALGPGRVAQIVICAHPPQERFLHEIIGIIRVIREADTEAVQPVEVVTGDVSK